MVEVNHLTVVACPFLSGGASRPAAAGMVLLGGPHQSPSCRLRLSRLGADHRIPYPYGVLGYGILGTGFLPAALVPATLYSWLWFPYSLGLVLVLVSWCLEGAVVLVLEEAPVKPLQPDLHPFSLGIDPIRGPAGHGTSCSHAAVILVLWRPLVCRAGYYVSPQVVPAGRLVGAETSGEPDALVRGEHMPPQVMDRFVGTWALAALYGALTAKSPLLGCILCMQI